MTRFAHVIQLAAMCTLTTACTYPSNLIGDWYSTSFGTLTFTNNSFSGFTSAISVAPLTFTCYASEGNKYVSKASFSPFAGFTAEVFLCMNLQMISDVKYFYTLDTNRDPATNVRALSTFATDVTLSQVCTFNDTRTPGEYELLILKANISDSFVDCPSSMTSELSVTMTTTTTTDCNGTALNGQTSTALMLNYSSCASPRFNSGGHIFCLHHLTSTYTYLLTYNNDTSIDDISTFRFTCFFNVQATLLQSYGDGWGLYKTLLKSGAFLAASENPKACHTTQTPTFVNSTQYIIYSMDDLYYIPAEDKDYTVIIIVVCVIVFVIIVVLIVIIVVYIKICKKPRPPTPDTPPPKIRKKKPKMTITDYFIPRTMAGSLSQEDKKQIFKQSAEEILTGMAENAENKVKADNYQPPRREPWQNKWEKEMRPPTPSSARHSVKHQSSCNTLSQLGVMDLEQSATASTSLPDNLDHDSQYAFPTPMKRLNDSDRVGSRSLNALVSPRYSERYHAKASIPESTGKFGEANASMSTAAVNIATTMEPKLGTIAENPLSRENTTIVGARTNRTMETDIRPISTSTYKTKDHTIRPSTPTSTMIGSISTVSAGDVFFEPNRRMSRLSHLSASNASIFDDPTWLHTNSEMENTTFEVGKNLLPSIPGHDERDQKWFLKSQQKPEVHREDTRAVKGRMKTIGLNNQMETQTLVRSSSSLQIIEEEKRRRRQKQKKVKPKVVRPLSPHFDA